MKTKTILVIGATGAQGGSVARFLLADKNVRVRALTRNIHSPKALKLKAAGAEVVYGDLEDFDSLDTAMKNVDAVFGVTNFWEHYGKELKQGMNLIDAIVLNNIPEFILSTLPPAREISNGAIPVPHFDIKAELEAYARNVKPNTVFIHVAAYYENFYSYYLPQRGYDGNFYFGFPQGYTKYAAVSVEDIGGVVASLFREFSFYEGRTVGVVGDDLTPSVYADIMTEVLGKSIKYNYIPKEEFAAFNFLGAKEMANMFDFNRRFITERRAELEESKSLFPQIRSFRTWLMANRGQFHLPVAGSWLLTGS